MLFKYWICIQHNVCYTSFITLSSHLLCSLFTLLNNRYQKKFSISLFSMSIPRRNYQCYYCSTPIKFHISFISNQQHKWEKNVYNSHQVLLCTYDNGYLLFAVYQSLSEFANLFTHIPPLKPVSSQIKMHHTPNER